MTADYFVFMTLIVAIAASFACGDVWRDYRMKWPDDIVFMTLVVAIAAVVLVVTFVEITG